MARISFCFLIVVVFATSLMFDGTRARFTEKLTMSTEEAEIKNELAKEILLKAETIAILEAELQRNNPLKEIMLSDELKCIPCGQNCISSRNCCSPCRCNFGPAVPICAR